MYIHVIGALNEDDAADKEKWETVDEEDEEDDRETVAEDDE